MADIHVEVDLDDWERTGLKWVAALLAIGGLASAAAHIHDPQPFLPYTAAFGIIVGIGLGIALDGDSEEEGIENAPLGAVAGYVTVMIGVAVLPLGAFTPQPYVAAGATGLTLVIVGALLMAVFDPDITGKSRDTGDVPDDPAEILDGGDD